MLMCYISHLHRQSLDNDVMSRVGLPRGSNSSVKFGLLVGLPSLELSVCVLTEEVQPGEESVWKGPGFDGSVMSSGMGLDAFTIFGHDGYRASTKLKGVVPGDCWVCPLYGSVRVECNGTSRCGVLQHNFGDAPQ